jgi:hypothetical protein
MSDAEHEAAGVVAEPDEIIEINEAGKVSSNEAEQIADVPAVLELAVVHEGEIVDQDARIRIFPTRIEFVGKMSFDQWREALRTWQRATAIFHIGLADIIHYGKQEFGEGKVDETLELFGFDMADVLKAHAIDQLSLDIRDVNLTGEHYYVLAKSLPNAKKEQGRWAAIATKEKLTPGELKASIEKGKVIRQSERENTRGSDSGVPNIEGLSLVFQRWEKQAGGEEKILAQPLEWKQKLLHELHPIVELAEKVKETLPAETQEEQAG